MTRTRLFLAGLFLTVVAACNTPSVPLPPPVLQALTFQSAGMATPGLVVLQGKPTPLHADARFYVFNRSRGDGVITTAAGDGSFTSSPFAATDGDTAQIYYDNVMGDRSQDVCAELRLGVMLISSRCP